MYSFESSSTVKCGKLVCGGGTPAVLEKEEVQEAFRSKELLDTEDVAEYLGVSPVTIWRWCRDGSLPCLKIGRSWRIRRTALETFLERSERSETLVGRLRDFLKMPDNVLGIAQTHELILRLDAAFLQVGEARGGTMVKYHRLGQGLPSADELCDQLERHGFEASRLEKEGRFRLMAESGPPGERTEELKRLVDEMTGEGRVVWVNCNWETRLDLEESLRQQKEISELVEDSQFVVKTSVLEETLDDWPGTEFRRAQIMHSGTVWLSESGLALSRVTPPPLS